MSSTFMRHSACNVCRQRKVRCDGGRPRCHNCAVRGSECTYARPGSQGNPDLHRMVKELNERLKSALERPKNNVGSTILEMIDDSNGQTSETLASSSSLASAAQPSPVEITASGLVSPFTASLDTIAGNDGAPLPIPDNVDLAPHSPWPAYPWETPESSTHTMCEPDDEFSSALRGTESSQQESLTAVMQANASCTWSSEDEIPRVILNDLYQCYLDKAHGGCPIVERSSFFTRLGSDPMEPEMLSLKYISLAHGASLSQFHRNMHATLYRKARHIFDEVEGVDNITNIVYFQACILLALYELMHAQFLRARSSTAHALWMAKALGLHKIDQPFSPFLNKNTSNTAEIEEWRRAFWELMNLSCYVSASVEGDTDISINFAEITTCLPADASLGMPLAGAGLSLQDSDYIPERGSNSPTQGLILSTALLGQSLVHVNKSTKEQKGESSEYNFWMHQYRLTESLAHLSNALAVDSNHIPFVMDPEILGTSMNIQAAKISLDRAATRGFAGSNVSIFPGPKLKDRHMKAAMEIKNVAQQMRHLDLARVSPFIPWAIHVAAQVFVRDLLPVGRTKGSSFSAPMGSIDSLQSLLAILSQIKSVYLLAGSIESQIRLEITGVKALTNDLPVG